MAFIAALSVNVVETRHERPGSPRFQGARQLSAALALRMAEWWRPSAECFGRQISKTVLTAALTEIGQDGLAIRVRAAKKLDAARLAIPALTDAGWLPAPLRSQAGTPEAPDDADREENEA